MNNLNIKEKEFATKDHMSIRLSYNYQMNEEREEIVYVDGIIVETSLFKLMYIYTESSSADLSNVQNIDMILKAIRINGKNLSL